MIPLTLLLSLWWIVPLYVQSKYGIDFLKFTEQPGTIWGTTSVTESLRLMGFWLSYAGVGFTGTAIPYFDDARTLLFSTPVVLATLLLPAAALTGFVWTRRWRYGPFFLGLALVAVLVMVAGYPSGTLLRHGLTGIYNRVNAIRFLRTTYKAGCLLAIALACLAGAGGWGGLESPAGAELRGAATVAGATTGVSRGRGIDRGGGRRGGGAGGLAARHRTRPGCPGLVQAGAAGVARGGV